MTSFYKLSGSGNDFLALVEPAEEPQPSEIRRWCARGLSIGADGLFTLRRSAGGARMVHYNADGGRAELCVNGTRCAARLALRLGWATDEIRVETDAGGIAARERDALIALTLPPPDSDPEPLELEAGGAAIPGWRLRVGVPHLVVPWAAGVARAPVADLGQKLRRHPALGAAGANVDFVDWTGEASFDIRTFERGVEEETLACGSGVLAAAAVGVWTSRLRLPAAARTRGGFELRVEGRAEDGRIRGWSLAGDARLLAEGRLVDDPPGLPEPPGWS